jgi:hypothetical protein
MLIIPQLRASMPRIQSIVRILHDSTTRPQQREKRVVKRIRRDGAIEIQTTTSNSESNPPENQREHRNAKIVQRQTVCVSLGLSSSRNNADL